MNNWPQYFLDNFTEEERREAEEHEGCRPTGNGAAYLIFKRAFEDASKDT